MFNGIPSREVVKSLKEKYKVGTRVELTHMDDIAAPPIGTKGTVTGVDDIGSIMVKWDNGSMLHVCYGEDSCKIITDEKSAEKYKLTTKDGDVWVSDLENAKKNQYIFGGTIEKVTDNSAK